MDRQVGAVSRISPIYQLHRMIGNKAVQRLLQDKIKEYKPTTPEDDIESREEEFIPENSGEKPDENLVLTGLETPVIPLNMGFHDLGKVGTTSFEKQFMDSCDPAYPKLFVDGGRTGAVIYAGGGGAGPHGNQMTGSIQASVVPIYDSRSLGAFSGSEAWGRTGTGSLTVTRSYVGMSSGDQGNGYYVTARAASRADQHEDAHVQNSRGHYNTYLQPLLTRILNYTPAPAGGGRVITRYLQTDARSALESHINWQSSITSFQTNDTADNRPMGAIDQSYLASSTRIVDGGPGTVGGTAYQHRIHILTEPTPT